MLTSDMLRVKRKNGIITPRYLDGGDPKALERAAALVGIFRDHLGDNRGEIDEEVEEAIGFGTDFVIWRGLAKLLYDRSEFAVPSICPPEEIREIVFDEATRAGNPIETSARWAVLEKAAQRLGLAAKDVEAWLYADLEDRQVLAKWKELTPEALLQRYNVALAQAMLYRAVEMRIFLQDLEPNRLRRFFQMLKFHRLMHQSYRKDEGLEIVVNGPASLFKKGRKYGIEMAKFLPALLHFDGWKMEAEVPWENRNFLFQLDEQTGLVPLGRPKGQWIADEERWFEERFEEKSPPGWTLQRRGEIVDLGDNEVLITDYLLTDPAEKEVLVEILGFWRGEYLRRRLGRLKTLREGPPVVLVVSERLHSERQMLQEIAPEVVFFKGVILHERVLDAAQRALDQ